MPELQRLRDDHADAALVFELTNRAYFAASITDGGDELYAHFADHHRSMLAEQDAGTAIFHVLVADDGEILGRFNLREVTDGGALVGYRIAERVTGHGVATAALHELCRLAAERYELRRLTAAAQDTNVASRRVLEKAGFLATGPVAVAGEPGTQYELAL